MKTELKSWRIEVRDNERPGMTLAILDTWDESLFHALSLAVEQWEQLKKEASDAIK